MAEIGTATIKVLPDLAEFKALVDQFPDAGLTITEDITYERDGYGNVTRQTTVRTVSRVV